MNEFTCPKCGNKNSSLNELAKIIHQNAVDHGWWNKEPSFGEIIALCHSELSEALEEYRNGKPEIYFVADREQEDGQIIPEIRTDLGDGSFDGEKPEGITVELSDCIIRILDYCGYKKINIDEIIRIKMEYNKSRPYRHGDKVL